MTFPREDAFNLKDIERLIVCFGLNVDTYLEHMNNQLMKDQYE
jgi:hypothetical protein